MYASVPQVLAYQTLDHSDVYFSNGSHFGYFLFVHLLATWLSLRVFLFGTVMHLYCYIGATHIEEIMQL